MSADRRAAICLSPAEVDELLPAADCLELMEGALRAVADGEVTQVPRWALVPPEGPGRLAMMPSHVGGRERRYALKEMCVFPENPKLGLDPLQGVVLLHDGANGELLAMAGAAAVTGKRTAAMTALATRLLAREDAKVLTLVGAGRQAEFHLDALSAERDYEEIRVWSRSSERAEAFAERAGSERVVAVAELKAALAGTDVVVTVTGAREPIVSYEWLSPGCHVTAVGASTAAGRELDAETIVESTRFIDTREAALDAAGDLLAPLSAGLIAEDQLGTELYAVLTGAAPGRTSAEEITVFKSVGLGIQDLAIIEALYERALERGTGSSVLV